MHIHDIVIIGGGISGLFLAYNLIQEDKYKDILLIEGSSELGGRIRSEKIDGIPLEMGGARFSSKHLRLLSLIKKLGFEDKIVELPKDIDHYYANKKIKYDLKGKLSKLLTEKSSYTKKHLEKITLFQYSVEVYGYEESKKLQQMFGYDAEFLKLNAYSALEMFKEDLLEDVSYYVLNGGLSQLINKLEHIITDSQRVKIMKNTLLKDLQDKKIKVEIEGKEDVLRGMKIVSAIPYLDLRKMDIFKDYESLHSVKPIPLIRIYAKYPLDKSGKPWFHNLKRTITDNYIRHIIPISEEDGIIMISYSDFYTAEMWNNWYQLGEKVLTDKLHQEIHKLFKIKPPKPDKYKVYYWRGGVHMWRTKYPMDETYNKLLKPFDDKEIYLCNEAFCKHQCWIEGSLNMVVDILSKLKSKKPKIEKISLKQKGGKTLKKEDKSKKINKDYKSFTLEQVLKKKDLIIFEYNNKKWVHKIMPKWFKEHPGGGDRLREGVDANNFYDKSNPDRSKKSPTQLFKSIGIHSSSSVLKKYIIDGEFPQYIKRVGLLK